MRRLIFSGKVLLISALVLLLLALVAFPGYGQKTTPSVAVSPSTVSEGTDINITGKDFPGDQSVIVTLVGAHPGGVDIVLGRAKTDTAGAFQVTAKKGSVGTLIKGRKGRLDPMEPGTYTVEVRSLEGNVLATSQLTIAKKAK